MDDRVEQYLVGNLLVTVGQNVPQPDDLPPRDAGRGFGGLVAKSISRLSEIDEQFLDCQTIFG